MSVIINKEEYEIIKELPRGGFGRVYKLKKMANSMLIRRY